MARIEKTVFISYRRKDISWALAVYQYLTSQKYDVFFDFSSIPSGDFEQIILSNIRARAHFVLILTPTALNRCNEPGDWLRREIETALVEKRNIVPLFFDDFSFSSPSVSEKLTGPLTAIQHYNGLNIPSGYFMEAMERLRSRYLNVPLNAVLHPVSEKVQEVVKKEQAAADTAILKRKAIEEDVKRQKRAGFTFGPKGRSFYAIAAALLVTLLLGIFGASYLIQKISPEETPKSFTLDIGSTMVSPKDGMELVYVPAGEFTMGSDHGAVDEKPAHRVYLDAFWIDQTEVTNAMYAKCVLADECAQPSSVSSFPDVSYFSNSEFDNYPVINVSWEDAKTYCLWADRRLPTEAEWEKAARGENGNVFPWGNDAPNNDLLNYNYGVGYMTEVGAYPDDKSIYGVFDMAGNVGEWVGDWFSDTYYSRSPKSNPLGPNSGQYRGLRGGAWYNDDNEVRSADRNCNVPTEATYYGFRCARSE